MVFCIKPGETFNLSSFLLIKLHHVGITHSSEQEQDADITVSAAHPKGKDLIRARPRQALFYQISMMKTEKIFSAI